MEKENKRNNKKIVIIVLSIVVILLIVGFIVYIAHQKREEKLEIQNQEKIAVVKEKYNSFNDKIELLILSEEEQKQINVELKKVKKAIDEKNIIESTNKSIDIINDKIKEIEKNSNTILSDKENESNSINIDKFNEKQNNKVKDLQNIYEELKEKGDYKEAQSKIQEIINYKNNTNAEIAKAEEKANTKKPTNSSSSNYDPSADLSELEGMINDYENKNKQKAIADQQAKVDKLQNKVTQLQNELAILDTNSETYKRKYQDYLLVKSDLAIAQSELVSLKNK